MRIVVVCILAIVNLILESTLLQHARIYGIKPDFGIALIVAFAIMRGSGFGVFLGLGIGLLSDILYGMTIGMNAFSYMITGYIIGQVHENVFKDSYLPAIIFNIAAVFISQHIFYLLAYLTNNIAGTGLGYVQMLLHVILPQSLYNAVIGTIVYRYAYRLDEKAFMNKRIY